MFSNADRSNEIPSQGPGFCSAQDMQTKDRLTAITEPLSENNISLMLIDRFDYRHTHHLLGLVMKVIGQMVQAG